jgi:putative oxygen-independent coproporphyrinogen III oxidase
MSAFSLYVHIPYCQAKCPYCDFNSYAADRWPEARYVDALCAELHHYAQREPWNHGEIHTVFFGGGTPSLFAPASIARLLATAARLWSISADAEITLEANPGTVSLETLRGFRAAGINRMSFGVQSFWSHYLHVLGRIHSADDAVTAVGWSREAGFDNVNVDLIFALPRQTLAEWESDLAQATALQPDHISAYNLTYEEGTPFYTLRGRGVLQSLPEEIEVAMFTRTQEQLGAAGFEQYEISNYARPRRACRHNLNYWQSGDYLGIGAGAHSYAATGGWGSRWSNEKIPNRYIEAVGKLAHACSTSERLAARQARGEFVFLALRCRAGFSAGAFRERFGDDLLTAFSHAADLQAEGLLQCADGRWQLTPRGLLLADSVFATFL